VTDIEQLKRSAVSVAFGDCCDSGPFD